MTVDKLKMIATCNVKIEHKVKWLHWWNSSIQTREARHFPLKPVGESDLKSFLVKACWYAGISDFNFIFPVYSLYQIFWWVLQFLTWLLPAYRYVFIDTQIEDVVTEMFDTIVKKDNLVLDMDSPQEPEVLAKYIEG